jgi:hypothetical protein
MCPPGAVVLGILAVGYETAIHEPLAPAGLTLSLLLFGGPLLYLGLQTWYLRALTGRLSSTRLLGMGALILAAAATWPCRRCSLSRPRPFCSECWRYAPHELLAMHRDRSPDAVSSGLGRRWCRGIQRRNETELVGSVAVPVGL